jgi:hypothetical protein
LIGEEHKLENECELMSGLMYSVAQICTFRVRPERPNILMKLLRYLALMFIDAFGITHPSIEARDRAAKYIAFLMIALFVVLCSISFLVVNALRL